MGRSNFNAVAVGTTTANSGLVVSSQTAVMNQNSTNAVSNTFTLPADAQIVDIIVDVLTVFNSATSAVLSVGTAAAGTQYAGSVDVKTAAVRIRPTFTGAQLAAMDDIDTNTSVVATITPTGATSAGQVRVTILYVTDDTA
jgi:hypothetical protein